jgi:hypothetical protein
MTLNRRQLLASLTAGLTWGAAGCREGVKTYEGAAAFSEEEIDQAIVDFAAVAAPSERKASGVVAYHRLKAR